LFLVIHKEEKDRTTFKHTTKTWERRKRKRKWKKLILSQNGFFFFFFFFFPFFFSFFFFVFILHFADQSAELSHALSFFFNLPVFKLFHSKCFLELRLVYTMKERKRNNPRNNPRKKEKL